MLVYALSALADRGALEAALKHEHSRVQQAALILLSQPPHETLSVDQVVERASAADGELRRAAQSILQQHPEWGDQAAELVRRLIEQPDLAEADQEALRSYILAFQTSPAITDLVGQALTRPRARLPDARRILLLDAIAGCSLATLPDTWLAALRNTVNETDPEVRSQAVRTAAVLQVPQLDEALARIAGGTRRRIPAAGPGRESRSRPRALFRQGHLLDVPSCRKRRGHDRAGPDKDRRHPLRSRPGGIARPS